MGTFIFCICIAVLYLSKCFKHRSSCTILQVTKKLGGNAAGTASWAKNVGNELGQVLSSVLTDSEGDGLGNMVTGLVERYRNSNVPPPKLLYVDRDCCSTKLKSHFHEWSNLVIRLDVWHFMRQFAAGCCSESHALYATICMCVRVGYRRPSKIICSQKGSTLCQWGVEKTERRCCYAYNQERTGLALQTTHTGSGANNSSHQRSNRHIFF